MNHEDARAAVQEHILRDSEFRIERFLFDEQHAFVTDPQPFRTAVCSRRAGKTISCAADLINTCLKHPDVVNLYITLSRNNAKKIIWPELEKINQSFRLQGKLNQSELSIKFPNGSIIYCSGAGDKSEIEKFRGLPLKLCYIDEAQSFADFLRSLTDDVLGPALIDHAGTLNLIGTPGPVPAGYFHECAVRSSTWSHHAWTFWNNPHIAIKSGFTHKELFQRELTRRGVSSEDPSIQREWFGKWVLDSESLLIRYDEKRNDYQELPQAQWNYILGIDLGYDDADALAVLAWSESMAETYLVYESVVHKQTLSELVEEIQRVQSRFEVSKMVIDQGGLGKKIAEEIRRRHSIPVQPADKARKMENVALLNDALRSSRFKAKKNSRFAQDSYLLEIDRDKTTPDKIRVKDSFHSDIIDAALYAFRESPAFAYQAPVIKPKIGTKEWADSEVSEMEQRAQEHFESIEEASKGFGWNV